MKEIERYIKFWIENWYKIDWKLHSITYNFSEDNFIYDTIEITTREQYKFHLTCNKFNLISLVTSKEFIEAIARWILKKFKWDKRNEIYYTWSILSQDRTYISDWELIDEITTTQAISIRDNTLDLFINNLWIWQNV